MSKANSLDLESPPFCIAPGQSVNLATDAILESFKTIGRCQDKVSLCFAALIQCTQATDNMPLVVAGMNLSKSIDSGAGAGNGNPYHNAQHFCEVMLASYFLSLLDRLDSVSRLEVAVAALIHDFHHDGKGNLQTPFRLERTAVNESLPYLAEAGVSESQRQLVAALVLSTEVTSGIKIASACYAHHDRGSPLPALHVAAPELARLAEDPLAARQALILGEADLLPSVGLSIEHALRLQESLSKEWNTPLGLDDKLHFITDAFTGFTIGALFQPNVERLSQYLRQNTDAQGSKPRQEDAQPPTKLAER